MTIFSFAVVGSDKVGVCRWRNYGTVQYDMYKTLEVTEPSQHVFKVQLNRPDKSNAMNRDFWRYVVYEKCMMSKKDDTLSLHTF